MPETGKAHRLPSVEEYLKLEKDATGRRDYVGGVLHPVPTPTPRHTRISDNIYAALLRASQGGPCRVYAGGARVRIGDDLVYYPDIMAACEPTSDDARAETNPCLLAEVVSPETEEIDRREKVAFYQRIPSLKAYLMVEENRPVVERLFRKEGGEWERAAHFQTGSHPIPCPEMRLSLAEIYEGL